MKRDLVRYGKILLVVLTPGLIFLLFFLITEGTAENNWPFMGWYFILAAYLVIFGIVAIGLKFLVQKIGSRVRK